MLGLMLQTKNEKLIFKLGLCIAIHYLEPPGCAPKMPLGKAVKRGKVGDDRPPLDILWKVNALLHLPPSQEHRSEKGIIHSASMCK